MTMFVTINGERVELSTGATLGRFLRDKGFTTGRMACEVNGDIIRRADYDACVLKDGDVVEIVQMIGGG
jgi:sulfur carrier protein